MVSVPERFFADFESEFPSLATMQDATWGGSLAFAQRSVGNVVKYTAWESARRIEAIAIPAGLSDAAQALFDSMGSYMGGIGAMQSMDLPEVLLDTAGNFSSVANALGAFESVPIVGMILDFALTAIEGGLSAYAFKHQEELEAFPMGYDRDRDEDWTRSTLKLHAGTDLTPMFCPVNNAANGVAIFNTEIIDHRLKADEIVRAIYVPQGNATANLGGLPNTPQVPKGWEMNYAWSTYTRPQGVPWSHFMPSMSQAVLASWQSVLSNSRACYLVDAVEVASQWEAWQDAMELWGWGTRYSGNDRRRIAMLSRPPVDYATQQRIGADGFRHLLPWMPGAGLTKGKATPYYGPLVGDVASWAAKVQLARRQRKYLGTLTVAYCSERDPAFRSDPLLADLLVDRRRMLLAHGDAVHVDLSQVVDADYREALATRMGPKGLADAPPGSPTAGPGTIALPGAAGALPPVLVAKAGDATPFLPTTRSHGGNGMKNAAVLALLSFLLR